MPQTAAIRQALKTAVEQLGAKASTNPPATPAQLEELQAYVGPLSYEFETYLKEHNGLRIADENVEHLWGVEEILGVWAAYDSAALPERLAPVSGDPKGRRDWLILNEGDLHGAVLCWNPWDGGADLIASNLGEYISAWAAYVCERSVEKTGASFDSGYVSGRDKALNQMLQTPDAIARQIEMLGLRPAGKGCPRD